MAKSRKQPKGNINPTYCKECMASDWTVSSAGASTFNLICTMPPANDGYSVFIAVGLDSYALEMLKPPEWCILKD